MSDPQQPAAAPTFDMVDVESSNIDAVGYDPAAQVLRVKFRDGSPYDYQGVPPQLHAELMGAESKGGFFFKRIRNAKSDAGGPMFPFQKVTPQQQEQQEADGPA